jgi:hypothetical protein
MTTRPGNASFVPPGSAASNRSPSDETPAPPSLPPNVTALVAAVELVRAQLHVCETALDTVLALIGANTHTAALLANARRDRAANERAESGLPPVFGRTPDGWTPAPSPASPLPQPESSHGHEQYPRHGADGTDHQPGANDGIADDVLSRIDQR